MTAALNALRRAAREAGTPKLRHDLVVIEALTLACGNHPKGVLLEAAWNKAAVLSHGVVPSGFLGQRLKITVAIRLLEPYRK